MDASKVILETSNFGEDEDDQEILLDLFSALDSNKDGLLFEPELNSAVLQNKHEQGEHSDYAELVKACRARMKSHKRENGVQGITLQTLKEVANQIPRARGQRVQWVKSIGLEGALARRLKRGALFDQLSGLKKMTETEMNQACDEFCKEVPNLVKAAWEKLIRGKASTTAEVYVNSKFSKVDATEGKFVSLDEFYAGPEHLIGSPNPKVEEGIRKEHCDRSNAKNYFTTDNYNITTCPYDEWHFVMDPEFVRVYPHTPKDKDHWKEGSGWKGDCGREIRPLEHFRKHHLIKRAKLQKPEVGCLRLYTGPMFVLYNAVLRGSPAKDVEHLKGNRYETTLFTISSGIAKLSKFSQIPTKRLLYRGLGGILLPKQFWEGQDGFKGGVELGLMSTTANRNIAVEYSGINKKRATIFEIEAGRIDIGADLRPISQYPGEQEFLMPPLSCLEVVGDPRVDSTEHGEVVVFRLRVNMNLKILTFEQLTERRKVLHISMAKHLREELELEAKAKLESFQASEPEKYTEASADADNFFEGLPFLTPDFELVQKRHAQAVAGYFNDNTNYKEMLAEALEKKVRILNKQEAIITLRVAGASVLQLKRCSSSDCMDFEGHKLPQDPEFTWQRICSKQLKKNEEISVPLEISPAEWAIVWDAVFTEGLNRRKVRLGQQVLTAAPLKRNLCLNTERLQYKMYGNAVAGLILSAASTLVNLDIRGHEFSPATISVILRALTEADLLVTFDDLTLLDQRHGNRLQVIREGKRNGVLAYFYPFISQKQRPVDLNVLDSSEWAFVWRRATVHGWTDNGKTLDLWCDSN